MKTNLVSRRECLQTLAGLGLATVAPGCAKTRPAAAAHPAAPPAPAHPSAAQPDLIRRENERPGTREWMLAKTAVDPQTRYRCPWIEGYCSHTSIRAGETLEIFVSTNPASPFHLEIFRTGYYGGTGARRMMELGPFPGRTQPDPPVGPNRLRECAWEPATRITIPAGWPSGVYVGKLTADRGGWQSYVVFIVRDHRRADFIFQCSDTTWQAYNRWPSQYALYDDGRNEWHCGPGVDVSFDRPYGKYCQILDAPLSTGSGEWFLWEFPLAYWMEAQGFDVTYISNLDTHADYPGLLRARGFLLIGHDEYYTLEMYNHLRAAIARGLNVAFLSGNTCCGRIEMHPSARGTPNRIYGRADYFGPRDEGMIQRFPSMGAFPHASPHEGLLLGARNVPPCTGGADWICVRPDHWVFAGTGMRRGEAIPGLVGWEFHGEPADIPGLEVVASGPTSTHPQRPENVGAYAATLYPGPHGNFVFNASSCWWADGLSAPPGYVRPSVYTTPRGPDRRVQQITRNLLERMQKSPWI